MAVVLPRQTGPPSGEHQAPLVSPERDPRLSISCLCSSLTVCRNALGGHPGLPSVLIMSSLHLRQYAGRNSPGVEVASDQLGYDGERLRPPAHTFSGCSDECVIRWI